MPSIQVEKKPQICDLRDAFGGSLDYFLFGVNSSVTFSQAMDFFIQNFHANMVRLEDFSIAKHPLNAKFQMAYALFEMRGYADSQPENIMDFLSVVLFQNRAISFDRPQPQKPADLFDIFSEEPEAENGDLPCFALNNHGFYLQKWSLKDIDYLVMISSNKSRDAAAFSDYFNTFPINKANLTSFIRCNPQQFSANKIPPHISFVRSISNYAQREIAKDLEFSELCAHRRAVIQNDNENKSK